jgi:cytoskeletal protein RodZ
MIWATIRVEYSMAAPRRRFLVVIAVILVLSVATLVFALAKFGTPQTAEPNLPVNSIAPTSSQPASNSPVMNSPTPTPTQMPESASTPSPAPSASPIPTPTSSQVTSANGTFQLMVSVDKSTYSTAEPVNVTLSITNISNQTAEFENTGLNFDFTVADSNGNIVYQYSIGRAIPQYIALESLAPGQNVTATYSWSQITNTNASTSGTLVSPGTYYIVGKSNPIYGLQTDPVQITIVGS